MIWSHRVRNIRSLIVVSGFIVVIASLSYGQSSNMGNSVSGHVFGVDRRPVADAYVELLNDLGQNLNRTRTNSSGHYSFFGLTDGRFKLRVLPLGTDYEQQEQDFEIINIRRNAPGNQTIITGMMSEQRDFYLRPRKGVMPGVTGAIFVQEVPEEARKLYRNALDDLAQKKKTEAYTALKSAIELFPKYFDALELLGTEYVREGHFEAAAILLSLAIEVNPRAYKSWHGLAVAQSSMGDRATALTSVEKSIEINPIAPESLLLAGSLLRQAKRYDEAEKRLIKANEGFEGSSADVHWELALLYANGQKKYREAAKELKLFLKAKPDYKDVESVKKLITEFEEKAKTSG